MMQLRQADLTWQSVGDDLVVLDLKGSVYLKLNGSGKVLWEALADGRSDSGLTSVLVDRFGIDEERAATDVATFLADLRARGLLVE
jgi:Coenzyme PQQ synthesis protein D (PqqD)